MGLILPTLSLAYKATALPADSTHQSANQACLRCIIIDLQDASGQFRLISVNPDYTVRDKASGMLLTPGEYFISGNPSAMISVLDNGQVEAGASQKELGAAMAAQSGYYQKR